ncbi:complex I assembly factor ACAD9, mitochondrial-like [Contarinia nasturtii]|uniref:complex I assembly factor ACAD9, mitochondrial-like n=1 Tax=Contarinia nasturtii TaxID=265458 RepID=UPI0012D405EA|nr:complex I assembly factor ACAD9, mitochondrial-like [Contarinia nasturtii]
MILRRGVVSCTRTNMYRYRSISISSKQFSVDDRKNLPSRKLFEELTEKAYMQEKFRSSGRKPFETLVENPIIVKRFFAKELQCEEIVYPELMTKENSNEFNKTTSKIMEYLKETNTHESKQFETLKQLKLFGSNIPKDYDGQEYTNTERALIGEIETENVSVAMILNAHRLVSSTIYDFGTDQQRDKYLPKLASGEIVGTIAFKEWNASETLALNTRAEYENEDGLWYLNGTKSCVVNAINANVFLVLAQTKISDRQGDKKSSLTVFIVDDSLPGVKIHPKDNTIGTSDWNLARVTFKDVELTTDAVVALAGTGNYLEHRIKVHSRISEGITSLTQMKILFKYMLNMIESIEQQANNVSEGNESVTLRVIIGKYTCSIYALESMLYLTTGIMDKYDNTNIDLESAIFVTTAQDQLLHMTTDLLNFVDSRVTIDKHPMNSFIRNVIQLKFTEPNSEVKLSIAREGFHHRLRRLIEERKNQDFIVKNFKDDDELFKSFEPEMHAAIKNFNNSLTSLRWCATGIIELESKEEKGSRDPEMTQLADVASSIYASYASLLRANRSIKLKLPNAQEECIIAQTICDKNHENVKRIEESIQAGLPKTFQTFHKFVSYEMLRPEKQFPVHPLTRLF